MSSVRPSLQGSQSFPSSSSLSAPHTHAYTRHGTFQRSTTTTTTPYMDESLSWSTTSYYRLNARERQQREKQRKYDYQERKTWRTTRLKSITNQWADNRYQNSSLEQPRRSSWIRTNHALDQENNTTSSSIWNRFFCCCCCA